jgi:hypothetical protein
MSLAEVLPAVRALTREEKEELMRIVGQELTQEREQQLREMFPPGIPIDIGYGLFDEKSCEAAAIMAAWMEERKKSS